MRAWPLLNASIRLAPAVFLVHLACRPSSNLLSPTYPVCTSLTYHRDHLTSTSHRTSPHCSAQTSLHSLRAFRFWPLSTGVSFRVFPLTHITAYCLDIPGHSPSEPDSHRHSPADYTLSLLYTRIRRHSLHVNNNRTLGTSQKPCDNDHCPLLLYLALSVVHFWKFDRTPLFTGLGP
jgi:hypothetical protein